MVYHTAAAILLCSTVHTWLQSDTLLKYQVVCWFVRMHYHFIRTCSSERARTQPNTHECCNICSPVCVCVCVIFLLGPSRCVIQYKYQMKNIKYGLFISHNITSFYSLFIQANNMFRPMFFRPSSGHKNVCLEEVIQGSHKIK